MARCFSQLCQTLQDEISICVCNGGDFERSTGSNVSQNDVNTKYYCRQIYFPENVFHRELQIMKRAKVASQSSVREI